MSPANYFSAAAALGIELYPNYHDDWYGPVTPQAVKQLAERCGVEMVTGVANHQLAGPIDKKGRPLTERRVGVERSLALWHVDFAHDLGLGVLRIVEPNLDPENQHLADQYLSDHADALRPIGDYAETLGISIAVENYGLFPTQIDQLLQITDHSNVGTLFDPCNYARMGANPLDAMRLLGDRIVYCHLKDTKDDEDRSPDEVYPGSRWRPSVGVGDGDIEWVPLLAELHDRHEGYASIEYESADDVILGTRRSLDFVADTLEASS